MKRPRHGWLCQRCNGSAGVVIVKDDRTGDQRAVCAECLKSVLPVMPAPQRKAIKRALLAGVV